MINLAELANQLNQSIEDVRFCIMDAREDWETCSEITDEEADLIRQTVVAALPESSNDGQIQPVVGLDINKQQTIVDNASQVMGMSLVLAASQEIKMADALQEVKNAVILANFDKRASQLDAAVKERNSKLAETHLSGIQDFANQIEKPLFIAEEMVADTERHNAQLAEILAAVRAGK